MAALTTKRETIHRGEKLDSSESLTGIYEDECTWLAETLNGSMRTSFNLKVINGEICSEEKDENGVMRYRKLRTMFEEGAEYAQKRAATDSRVAFEPEREKKHLIELDIMEKMIAGQAPNTMIVVSAFPESLSGEDEEDIQGYKPKLRRSMLRVITANQDGTIDVKTQSLDNTNQEALLAIYGEMNWPIDKNIDSECMLGERMHLELSAEKQACLMAKLTGAYDNVLREKNGGDWRAGRRQPELVGNTWDFVLAQQDILKHHLADIAPLIKQIRAHHKDSDEASLGKLRAIAAATIRDRYEGRRREHTGDVASEMHASVSAAAANNETFGGCGLTVKLSAQEDMMQKMGYRQQDTLKCVTCPLCGATVNAQRTIGGIKCPACKKEQLSSGKIIDHDASQSNSSVSKKTTIWDLLRIGIEKKSNDLKVVETVSVGGVNYKITKGGKVVAEGAEAKRIKRSLSK